MDTTLDQMHWFVPTMNFIGRRPSKSAFRERLNASKREITGKVLKHYDKRKHDPSKHHP
jgi:hypothetical protein